MMGCADAASCRVDSYPAHAVALSAFAIQQFEVSQAEYGGCLAAGACTEPAANFDPQSELPVRDVTWTQAAAYCGWIGMRLPTEAEWERAARGDDRREYPWGAEAPTCALANFQGCGGIAAGGGTPAGASPFGVEDMGGNVSEWVSDLYAADYYGHSPASDPSGPAGGSMRVARGGNFAAQSYAVLASNRISANPAIPYDSIGIRCARSAP